MTGHSLTDLRGKCGAPRTQGRLSKLETFQHLGGHVRIHHAAGEHSVHGFGGAKLRDANHLSKGAEAGTVQGKEQLPVATMDPNGTRLKR